MSADRYNQVAVASRSRMATGPPTPFLTNCQLRHSATWAPLSYASSVAFNSCVLLFTLSKLHDNLITSKTSFEKQVYKDNLLYLILLTTTDVIVLVIQGLKNQNFDRIRPAATPFSTLMTVTMGTRVFLNLRQFNRPQEQEFVGNPFPLFAHSEDVDSLFSAVR